MLTITDADRALAAELGLYLVQLPETSDDRKLAADPSALRTPQNWAVKSTIDHSLVGLLYFTHVDSLYATRYTTGISAIDESVADALRWMTRLRHVRTGTDTAVHRESPAERARAVTECGAMATGADFTQSGAKSAVVNGSAEEVCPLCLTRMKDRGVLADVLSHAEESGSSTPRQRDFIRRLLNEAATCGRPFLMDTRDIDQMSGQHASAIIDALKSLKARHWQGDL